MEVTSRPKEKVNMKINFGFIRNGKILNFFGIIKRGLLIAGKASD
jgi:hypothetical protein